MVPIAPSLPLNLIPQPKGGVGADGLRRKSLTVLRLSVFICGFLLLPLACPAGDDARLVLKSDSKDGVWRFYPAKTELRLRRVLLIGDSIMNGYHSGVTAQLKGRATVDFWLTPLAINSPELHEDLRTVIKQGPYDVIHFNIGLHEWPKGFIPDGQYEPLLRAYVKTLRDNAAHARLIWASTTQITVQDKPVEVDPENNPTIAERNVIAARVMQENGIAVDDLYTLMSDKLELAKGDKFHWSPKGVAVQADAVAAMIGDTLWKIAKLADGQGANYDEAKVGTLELPALLTAADGSVIATSKDWTAKRRLEVLELYREHVYGRTPEVSKTKFVVTAIQPAAFGGLATRKLIHVTLPDYPQWQGMDVMLYVPNAAPKPVPVFCGLNFDGNHAASPESDVPLSTRWMRESAVKNIVDHRATEASRGNERHYWQLEMVLKRGYAVATAYYGDLEPDHRDGWKDGLRAVLGKDGANTVWKDGDWGAIGVWSWGLSRMLDYLETESDIDLRKAAVLGHSRLGKTALWSGAQDPRWALVIANNSGEGGGALMRRDFGETTEIITRGYPHWFTPKYKSYAKNAAGCPVDQHMLVALMAPRPIYLATAAEDLWSDPRGEFFSGKNAEPVYALFGKSGLGVMEQPAIDQPCGDSIRYHIRAGKHTVSDWDWEQFMTFAERHHAKLSQ